MNIAKFLILPILKNICKWVLFIFCNGSLLHGPKGLMFSLHDGVRLQGPSVLGRFSLFLTLVSTGKLFKNPTLFLSQLKDQEN